MPRAKKPTHGGPRKGAGRPKGVPNKEPAKQPLKARYALRLSPLAGEWVARQAEASGLKPTPFLEQFIEEESKKEGAN